MNKYKVAFRRSFLSYLAYFAVAEYVTARVFADIIAMIFTVCVIYELVYVIYFRKKAEESFGRSLADLFRYALSTPVTAFLLMFAKNFIFGSYVGGGLFGYGAEWHRGVAAIINDSWNLMSFGFCLAVNVVYNFFYMAVSSTLKNKAEKNEEKQEQQ